MSIGQLPCYDPSVSAHRRIHRYNDADYVELESYTREATAGPRIGVASIGAELNVDATYRLSSVR